MVLSEFESFKKDLKELLEKTIKGKKISEKFKQKMAALEIIINTFESIFKVLPTYDVPLINIGVLVEFDIINVEFELLNFLDICLLGAYHSTIKEYLNTPISDALEEMLTFDVVSMVYPIPEDGEYEIQPYDIWRVMHTPFLITKQENNKIKLYVATGLEFFEMLTPKG